MDKKSSIISPFKTFTEFIGGERMKDRDFILGLFVTLIGIAGYFYASTTIKSVSRTALSDSLYVEFLYVAFALCGVLLMYRGIKRKEKATFPTYSWGLLLISIFLLILYAYLLRSIGFIISSILFIFAFMLVLGERKPLVLVSIPLSISLGVYFLFAKVFMIVLP